MEATAWCLPWTWNHIIPSFPMRKVKDSPTNTLVHIAQLSLTLNTWVWSLQARKWRCNGRKTRAEILLPSKATSKRGCWLSTPQWGHIWRLFRVRGYPHDLTRRARLRAEAKQKADLWPSQADRHPLVITYHPKNIDMCNILLRNYSILGNGCNTKVIFCKPPLKAFRSAKNLS